MSIRSDSGNSSLAWPDGSDWQFANPGDTILSDCKNWYVVTEELYMNISTWYNFVICFSFFLPYFLLNLSSCKAGVLQCQADPGCHVNGGWSWWGDWTECSLPCGGGVQFRRRQCDNPSPQSGGRGCLGVAQQQRDCNTHLCTGSPVWPDTFILTMPLCP